MEEGFCSHHLASRLSSLSSIRVSSALSIIHVCLGSQCDVVAKRSRCWMLKKTEVDDAADDIIRT